MSGLEIFLGVFAYYAFGFGLVWLIAGRNGLDVEGFLKDHPHHRITAQTVPKAFLFVFAFGFVIALTLWPVRLPRTVKRRIAREKANREKEGRP